jgi:hypothetical protein
MVRRLVFAGFDHAESVTLVPDGRLQVFVLGWKKSQKYVEI